MKKKILLTAVILISALCTSCFNFNRAHVKISICPDEYKVSRTAAPVLPQNIFYKIKATDKATENRNADVEQTEALYSGNNLTYQLALEQGEWNIAVTGYSDSERTKKILEGSKDISVSSNGYYDLSIPVYFSSTGNGSVNLEINVTGTTISKLVVTGSNSSLDGTYAASTANGVKKITIAKQNVPAGNYSVSLNFQESNSTTVAIFSEMINVRNDIATDHWIKNGNTIYLSGTVGSCDADFVISKSVIESISLTQFWVKGSSGKLTLNKKTPSDENSGSWLAPLATLGAAGTKILALYNNKTTDEEPEYEIHLDGAVTECFAPDTTDEKYTLNIISNESTGIIKGPASENQIALKVNGKKTVILRDVIVEGNIIVSGEAKLILQGKTIVTGKVSVTDSAKVYIYQPSLPAGKTKLASVSVENPSEGKVVIEKYDPANPGTSITADEIKMYEASNPGWYLYLSGGKGVLKPSKIEINEPEKPELVVTISGAGYSDSAKTAGQGSELTVTIKNKDGTKNVAVKKILLCLDDKVLAQSNEGSNKIQLPSFTAAYQKNMKYDLYIYFEWEQIELLTMQKITITE